MAYGICYTQSGSTKKYEEGGFEDRPNIVKFITGYTVGYPSTAYYPGLLCNNFIYWAYPGGLPELAQYPEYTEGTAIYFVTSSLPRYPSESEEVNNAYIGYTKIYNLMSYTPPDGYALDKNGPYTYTAKATVYSCNEGIKYFNAINSINGGTETIEKEFKYSKIIQTTYRYYTVALNIDAPLNRINCSCQRVPWVPDDNNRNFKLGVRAMFDSYGSGVISVNIEFEWEMKNGINETKYIPIPNPVYSGSGFTTKTKWEFTDSSGNITKYTFYLQVR